MLGDWDAAGQELTQAVDGDRLAGIDRLTCYQAWLAALRGDAATAATLLAAIGDMRASEDSQDKAAHQRGRGIHRGRPPPAPGRAPLRPRGARSTLTPSA
jgi:hypothetical protein